MLSLLNKVALLKIIFIKASWWSADDVGAPRVEPGKPGFDSGGNRIVRHFDGCVGQADARTKRGGEIFWVDKFQSVRIRRISEGYKVGKLVSSEVTGP